MYVTYIETNPEMLGYRKNRDFTKGYQRVLGKGCCNRVHDALESQNIGNFCGNWYHVQSKATKFVVIG